MAITLRNEEKDWEQRISTMLLEAWGTLTVYKNSYAHLSTEIVDAWPQGLEWTGWHLSILAPPPGQFTEVTPWYNLGRWLPLFVRIMVHPGLISTRLAFVSCKRRQDKEVWLCFLQSRQVDPDICVFPGSPKALDVGRQDYDHGWALLSVTISLSQRGATVYPLMERNGMHRLSMRLDTMDRKKDDGSTSRRR